MILVHIWQFYVHCVVIYNYFMIIDDYYYEIIIDVNNSLWLLVIIGNHFMIIDDYW